MLTDNAIRRLAFAGGVERLNREIFDIIRIHIESKLSALFRKLHILLEYTEKKVITKNDLRFVMGEIYIGKEKQSHWSLNGFKRNLKLNSFKDINRQSIDTKIEIYNRLCIDYFLIPEKTFKLFIQTLKDQLDFPQYIKFSSESFDVLQEYIETYVIRLFFKTQFLKRHFSRQVTIEVEDINAMIMVLDD